MIGTVAWQKIALAPNTEYLITPLGTLTSVVDTFPRTPPLHVSGSVDTRMKFTKS